MNTNDLKKKIIGLANEGPRITEGGAYLASILNSIVKLVEESSVQSDWNQSDNAEPDYIKNKPEISKPIVLSVPPDYTMSSQSELDNIGLTKDEIIAASKGERDGVIIESEKSYYPIMVANYTNENTYRIVFGFVLWDDTPSISSGYTISITASGGNIEVSVNDM